MAYKKYTVKQGDCITSIAFNKGFYEKTIWDHPDNAKLKNDRKDMKILQPGDKVVIRGNERLGGGGPVKVVSALGRTGSK